MQSVKFSRLIEFFNAANVYLKDNDERSTVSFALNKLIIFYRKKIEKIQRMWQDEANDTLEDIRVKYCEKDKDGVFKEKVYGEGQNLVIKKVFTGENERKADKEILVASRDLEDYYMNYEVTDIKVHIVDVPPTMDIMWIESFSGFIFKPMSEDELESHYLSQGKKETELISMSNGVHDKH